MVRDHQGCGWNCPENEDCLKSRLRIVPTVQRVQVILMKEGIRGTTWCERTVVSLKRGGIYRNSQIHKLASIIVALKDNSRELY